MKRLSFSRELVARYLMILAALLVAGIDVTQYFIGGTGAGIEVVLLESVVDIALVLFVYVALSQEIRIRRKSEEALAAANQAKTRVMNMAAHDLRNPIGIIRSFSEFLMEDPSLSTESKHYAERIQKKCEEMLSLVEDLLDVTVVTQRGLKLSFENFDLNTLVTEVVVEVRSIAENKRQMIRFEKAEDLPIHADRHRLKQVLLNILSNAVKYSPLNSTITVQTALENKSARVSVSDYGPGLKTHELEAVFEVFSEVKKRPTAGESSTGLGLSIAKSLIEQHDGRIWAESDGPGKGSRFHFSIPLTRKTL